MNAPRNSEYEPKCKLELAHCRGDSSVTNAPRDSKHERTSANLNPHIDDEVTR